MARRKIWKAGSNDSWPKQVLRFSPGKQSTTPAAAHILRTIQTINTITIMVPTRPKPSISFLL
jgi:hypothetical protein